MNCRKQHIPPTIHYTHTRRTHTHTHMRAAWSEARAFFKTMLCSLQKNLCARIVIVISFAVIILPHVCVWASVFIWSIWFENIYNVLNRNICVFCVGVAAATIYANKSCIYVLKKNILATVFCTKIVCGAIF